MKCCRVVYNKPEEPLSKTKQLSSRTERQGCCRDTISKGKKSNTFLCAILEDKEAQPFKHEVSTKGSCLRTIGPHLVVLFGKAVDLLGGGVLLETAHPWAQKIIQGA